MKITFIRHSKTNPNGEIPIEQWGLTDVGIGLAKNLSANPVVRGIEVMYSSLQTKALETAVLLAKPYGIQIKTDHRFTEISSFTKRFFTPVDYQRLKEEYYAHTIERIEGGETIEEAKKRFEEALFEVVEIERAAGRRNIGIVSHENILSTFSSDYSDQDPLSIVHSLKMPDVAVFDWEQKKLVTYWGQSL